MLKPGESFEAEFTGDIPEESRKCVGITVTFLMDTVTPACYRTQKYTVMNGDDVTFDGGYVSTQETPLNKAVGPFITKILKALGLNEFLSMIYSWFTYIFRAAGSLFAG